MLFCVSITVNETTYELPLNVTSFPSCCGASIIHGLSGGSHYEKVSDEDMQQIGEKFMLAVKAKETKQIPEGVKITATQLKSRNGSICREISDAAAQWCGNLHKSHVLMADAKNGEEGREGTITLYSLGMNGSEWSTGGLNINPNTRRQVAIFELHK